MTAPQITMKSVILPCLLVIAFGGRDAWSQGATGGSLGNDNKSLSGSSSEPRAAKPARPPRSERATPASRGSGDGSAARFDGTWQITFTGQTAICAGKSASSTLTISGGRTSDGGSISPNGALQGVGSSGSVSAAMTGRLSGRGGGGMMHMSNGCSGRWVASKL